MSKSEKVHISVTFLLITFFVWNYYWNFPEKTKNFAKIFRPLFAGVSIYPLIL
jgi:hypothetical protein